MISGKIVVARQSRPFAITNIAFTILLGVSSEKKTDDLKTFVKLVLTPPPPPNFGHFYFGQIYIGLYPPSPYLNLDKNKFFVQIL